METCAEETKGLVAEPSRGPDPAPAIGVPVTMANANLPTPMPPDYTTTMPPQHPSAMPSQHPLAMSPQHPFAMPLQHPFAMPLQHPFAMPPQHPLTMPPQHLLAIPSQYPAPSPLFPAHQFACTGDPAASLQQGHAGTQNHTKGTAVPAASPPGPHCPLCRFKPAGSLVKVHHGEGTLEIVLPPAPLFVRIISLTFILWWLCLMGIALIASMAALPIPVFLIALAMYAGLLALLYITITVLFSVNKLTFEQGAFRKTARLGSYEWLLWQGLCSDIILMEFETEVVNNVKRSTTCFIREGLNHHNFGGNQTEGEQRWILAEISQFLGVPVNATQRISWERHT